MCTSCEMVAIYFLCETTMCVSTGYEEQQKYQLKRKKKECCIVYLILVQAVYVLLEFIFYIKKWIFNMHMETEINL